MRMHFSLQLPRVHVCTAKAVLLHSATSPHTLKSDVVVGAKAATTAIILFSVCIDTFQSISNCA